jgi:hypothetical protein
MLADPKIQALVHGLAEWPGKVIASHKSAGQPYHRLNFLADLGLCVGDTGIAGILDAVMDHQSEEGAFRLPVHLGEDSGGSAADIRAWALCDAPLLVYALATMGLAKDARVRKAARHIQGLARSDGWTCVVSEELGNFRGPGKSTDPCPFATLAALKALSCFPDLRDCPATRAGVESLLSLWADSRTRHPYIFYMGTDFRKLKVPFVWYDLLHVLDVLSRFPWLSGDARLRDMSGLLVSKADPQGRFTPESVWQYWKDWEFGQKRQNSRWLSVLAWRILKRLD